MGFWHLYILALKLSHFKHYTYIQIDDPASHLRSYMCFKAEFKTEFLFKKEPYCFLLLKTPPFKI